MKIIAISALTAGGKTTVVNAIKKRLPKAASLHFDDYSFDGEVDDFAKWFSDGADVHVWDLSPLKKDIEKVKNSGEYDYLLLDYPFEYSHNMIKDYLDCCIFIDTPPDIALARRILRDMKDADADEIRKDLESYLSFARPVFIQMQNEHLSACDHIIDGSKALEDIINEAIAIITKC